MGGEKCLLTIYSWFEWDSFLNKVIKIMSYVKNKNSDDTKQLELSNTTPQELESIAQQAVKDAIKRMHQNGISTVEVDNDGTRYLRHPNGTRTLTSDKSIDKNTTK
jgi:hypothetical protein